MTAVRAGPARRAVAVGLAVGAAYVAIYVVTLVASGRHQRPLFDGFAPSAPYRWVDPPPGLEQGNQKPGPSSSELPLGDQGLPVGQANSDDGQLVLNLPDGAVPPHPGDSTVRIVIVPEAPDKLGSLPPDRYAAGNAYRVEMSYQPSGQKIDALATPGNVLLTLPWGGTVLLQSPDGKAWQPIEAGLHAAGTSVGGPVTNLGYFVGATTTPVGTSADAGSGGGMSVWLIVVIVAALAAGLVLVPVLMRRSRRRREEQKARAHRRRPPPSGSGKKKRKKH